MIIVTGGRGESNILLVNHLVNGRKMLNIADYMDKSELI